MEGALFLLFAIALVVLVKFLVFQKATKVAKIYLDPFARSFTSTVFWNSNFFLGSVTVSGAYQGRSVTCSYSTDKNGASLALEGKPLYVSESDHIPWYRPILSYPTPIAEFQLVGDSVIYTCKANFWKSPKADNEWSQMILDKLVLACEKVEVKGSGKKADSLNTILK